MQKMKEIAFIALSDTGGEKARPSGSRGNRSGSSGGCRAFCAVGALPPAPRGLTLWANSMSGGRHGRRKTAVVER